MFLIYPINFLYFKSDYDFKTKVEWNNYQPLMTFTFWEA